MASPSPIPASIAVALLLAAASTHATVVFTVGAGGSHRAIQDAVNACPSDGCVITLLDSLYELPREIWIGGKQNVSILASATQRDAGIRPHLRLASGVDPFLLAGTAANPTDPLRPAGWRKWPVDYTYSAGGSRDTINPYSCYGALYNGLVVVDSSRNVRLQGLLLDGTKPAYFVNKGVWSGKWDILFGNVGVNLHNAKSVVVRDCEIRNFFSGVFITGNNPDGLVAPNPQDGELFTHPGAKPGLVGDHVVETSWIHDNWWGVYDEMEWDLGSTFRFNRFTDNRNTSYDEATATSSEANNHAGGMLFVKDVPRAIHRIHNNTVLGSPFVIGHGGYNWGMQHLFYNNVVGGFDRLPAKLRIMSSDWRNALASYSYWLENNLFEVGAADSLYQIQTMSAGQTSDSSACAAGGQEAPCWVSFDQQSYVTTGIKNAWLWNGWTVRGGAPFQARFKGANLSIASSANVEIFPGGGYIDAVMGKGTKKIDIAAAQNTWVKTIPWKNALAGTTDYLVPVWDSSLVQATMKGRGRAFSGWAASLDVGAAVTVALDSDRVGMRNQLPLGISRSRCWMVPVRYDASKIASVRAVAVNAWATQNITSNPTTSQPSLNPVPLRVSALADSTLFDGASLEVCADTSTSPTTDIRIQIEPRATLKDGSTANLEPAYFLATGSTPVFASVRGSAGIRGIRSIHDGNRLILQGLADGEVRLELRALDGRVLRSEAIQASRGAATLELGGLARGTVLVRVRQGAQQWQGTTLLF